jgi:hypothetical protein
MPPRRHSRPFPAGRPRPTLPPPRGEGRPARAVWATLALLALPFGGASGQLPPGQVSGEGSIRGQVVDASSGRGIPAAFVEFVDPGGLVRASATAGEDGSFVLARVPRGEFRLRVSSLGYARLLSRAERIEAGETLSLVLSVHPSAIALAPLEVTGSERFTSPVLATFYARAERGVGGVFLTRDDIDRLQPRRLSELLATVPGVRMDASGTLGASPGVLLSRSPSGVGGRPCPVQIFLDGVPVGRNTGIGARSPYAVQVDPLARPEEVEGIEIYPSLGQVPAEFLTQDARCGVVAIWRRARS